MESLAKLDDYQYQKPVQNNLNDLNDLLTGDQLNSKVENISNKKIVLNETGFEYKIKNKMKAFMNGTYHAFVKSRNAPLNIIKEIKEGFSKDIAKLGKDSLPEDKWLFTGAVTLMTVFGGVCIHAIDQTMTAAPLVNLIQSVSEVNTTNIEMRDLSINVLRRYSKENKIKLIVHDENAILSTHLNKKQCSSSILDKRYTGNAPYEVNGYKITPDTRWNANLIEAICQTDNVVKVSSSLKIK